MSAVATILGLCVALPIWCAVHAQTAKARREEVERKAAQARVIRETSEQSRLRVQAEMQREQEAAMARADLDRSIIDLLLAIVNEHKIEVAKAFQGALERSPAGEPYIGQKWKRYIGRFLSNVFIPRLETAYLTKGWPEKRAEIVNIAVKRMRREKVLARELTRFAIEAARDVGEGAVVDGSFIEVPVQRIANGRRPAAP